MLRNLEQKDAGRMLEWMRDDSVIQGLQAEIFKNKTLEDCKEFIIASRDKRNNCHLAIVDKEDLYQGTVSLKYIDYSYKDAEFAIVLRRDARSKGYAVNAMQEIMQIAFEEYGLEEVYWNVLKRNVIAINLYEKGKYEKLESISKRRKERIPLKKTGEMEDIIFYHITKEQYCLKQ